VHRKMATAKLQSEIRKSRSGAPLRMPKQPAEQAGRFGVYGGRYVPETLMAALEELEREYEKAKRDPKFQKRLEVLLRTYAGRPTPLFFAKRLTEKLGGAKIYLKREDLLHTGAHKINNCIGQALLVERMGKPRVIAETGPGSTGGHGDGLCPAGIRVRGVYGHRRHAAPGIECIPHAAAGRGGPRSFFRVVHFEGRNQRGYAGLGDDVRTTHYLLGSVLGLIRIPRWCVISPRDRA